MPTDRHSWPLRGFFHLGALVLLGMGGLAIFSYLKGFKWNHWNWFEQAFLEPMMIISLLASSVWLFSVGVFFFAFREKVRGLMDVIVLGGALWLFLLDAANLWNGLLFASRGSPGENIAFENFSGGNAWPLALVMMLAYIWVKVVGHRDPGTSKWPVERFLKWLRMWVVTLLLINGLLFWLLAVAQWLAHKKALWLRARQISLPHLIMSAPMCFLCGAILIAMGIWFRPLLRRLPRFLPWLASLVFIVLGIIVYGLDSLGTELFDEPWVVLMFLAIFYFIPLTMSIRALEKHGRLDRESRNEW